MNPEENKKPNNPNAFPTMEHGYNKLGCPTVFTYEGMTLRDYFANSAYYMADAMLKERENV